MSPPYHRLLERQVRKHLGSTRDPRDLSAFLEAVDDAYRQFESSRQLLDRAMHLSSAELRAAMDEARESDRQKSAFIATMSHEIRTPMNAILGLSEALLGGTLGANEHHHVRLIHESADALMRLLNDILDYSKIGAGKLSLDPEPVELRPLLERALELYAPRAQAKGLDLRLHCRGHLPRVVVADAARLRQILVNLLGNAIKFTRAGTVTLEVEARHEAAQRALLRVAVRDTGIGIAPDRLPMLFQSFVQAEASTTREFGGTGLGLAISRELVQLMGGAIAAESEEGRGSVFHFEISVPVEGGWENERPAARAPRAETVEAVGMLAERFPLRILSVEDNAINAQVIGLLLGRLGYAPVHAANGAEALERLAADPFDLVLMDVQMPVLDGLAATRRLRETVPLDAPPYIVALTAGAARDDEHTCRDAGMHAFLPKPVRVQQLVRTLAEAHEWVAARPDEAAPARPEPRQDEA